MFKTTLKCQWLDKKILYTGEQLKPLTNYLQHGLLGDSLVGWLGPCNVTPDHMIDGEDLRASAKISADEMVHFVLELFDFSLKGAVVLQRLMAEIAMDVISDINPKHPPLYRRGDDIYWDDKKLNISIATVSSNSTLIHFAINTKETGAPSDVHICWLASLDVDAKKFAMKFMEKFALEFDDIVNASRKVRTF